MEEQIYFRNQAKDTCIALTPLLVMGVFYYGMRVIFLALVSILSAVVTDYVCRLLQGDRKFFKNDLSALLTGYLFVMMLPASVPYWLVIVGSAFAIAVVRHPFGGHYNTMFNPAITAFAFVTICWKDIITKYPAPLTTLPVFSGMEGIVLGTSPAYRLMNGGAEDIDFLNALLGNFYGPLGATCLIILFSCFAFLVIRKAVIWQIPAGTLGVVALFSLILPRVNANRFSSLVLELCSGILFYSVIFIASMDSRELKTQNGKWFYGIVLGLFIVLFRNISHIELVCPFAIIVISSIDHKCDKYAEKVIFHTVNISKNIWNFLKLICAIAVGGFMFLWNKLFQFIQKIIDR